MLFKRTVRLSFVGFFGVLLGLSGVVVADAQTDRFADTVLINGKFYLGKTLNPWASAVAIANGKFMYVGDDAATLAGPNTTVHDLNGRLVVPGLIDGHTHIGLVALSNRLIEISPASTKPELLNSIDEMLKNNPDGASIIGGYWPNSLFGEAGPHKRDLDRLDSSRPVILYDDWTHSVWANSKALKAAGVNRHTPDIVPGFSFYQKDKAGEPTGWITESAASVFLNNFQKVTPDVVENMFDYLSYFRSQGVTTLLDAGSFGLDDDVHAAIAKLDKEGRLPVRFHGSYTLFKPDDLPSAIANLKRLASQYNSKNIRIDTLKLFYDGVMETRTAAMKQDYLDLPGANGEVLFNRQIVHDLIIDLEADGFNLHVHSVGDRATTTLLNAVADVHKTLARPQSIRITACHLEFVTDSDFDRFKKLGVVANFTPHWWVGGDLSWAESGVGNLAFKMQRAQPLINGGAVVTFSSDNTTESEWKADRAASSPFTGMQIGHTRQDIGMSSEDPVLPPISDRLQIDDLVNGYTTDAAYQLGRSDIGLIAKGYRADLVVLNQNIFEVKPSEIHRTKPAAVFMDGEIVSGHLEDK